MKRKIHSGLAGKFNIIQSLFLILSLIVLASVFTGPLKAQPKSGDYKLKKSGRPKITMPGVEMDCPLAMRLPTFINSSLEEIRPFISADGRTLYFSRQHYPFQITGILNYEDIWYSTFNEITNMWSEPVNIGPPVVNHGPNSVNYISLSEDTILLASEYRMNGVLRQGISISIREGDDWSFFLPVGRLDSITSPAEMRQRILLTSSRSPDSYGKSDIYINLLNPDGTMEIINAGPVINTKEEESSPFLAADDKTLYFASKGHHGYGGYDIFVSHRLDDTWQNWSEPENLGPTVNTFRDEEYYISAADGEYAYFTRQISCRNSDIFLIAIPVQQHAEKKKLIPVN